MRRMQFCNFWFWFLHFTTGGHSGFEQLLLLTRVQLTRSAVQWGCHFLLRGKKWRKKRAKGPNALWIPAVRLCGRASAQHDAKGCIFSFCECDLKKVALTKVARTLLLQTAPALASFPVIDGSSNRTGKQKVLPLRTHLQGGLCEPGYEKVERLAPPPLPSPIVKNP